MRTVTLEVSSGKKPTAACCGPSRDSNKDTRASSGETILKVVRALDLKLHADAI